MNRRLVPAFVLVVALVSTVPMNAAPAKRAGEPSWFSRLVLVLRHVGLMPTPADLAEPTLPKP